MQIENVQGVKKDVDCLGCARERGEITEGNILRTDFFDAHQDFEIPIPGFVIVSSRKHVQRIDQLTVEEGSDCIAILERVRRAMLMALHIKHVTIVQEEKTRHHFHIWLFPWHAWMGEQIGEELSDIRPIMECARTNMKTAENLKAVHDATHALRAACRK